MRQYVLMSILDLVFLLKLTIGWVIYILIANAYDRPEIIYALFLASGKKEQENFTRERLLKA